jgi:hypothetical protein
VSLVILVPVLRRPHRVRPLLDSIRAVTPDAHVLFIADTGDGPEVKAILDAGEQALLTPDGESYAEKINAGVRATTEPLIFLGADDLDFKPGWFDAAREKLGSVVGINDLIPRGRQHATHFLLTREYAERPMIDGELGPLSTAYRHWYVDNELIETATARGAYAYAPDAHVEHLHPLVSKAPLDDTYELGTAHSSEDRTIFKQRRRMWA